MADTESSAEYKSALVFILIGGCAFFKTARYRACVLRRASIRSAHQFGGPTLEKCMTPRSSTARNMAEVSLCASFPGCGPAGGMGVDADFNVGVETSGAVRFT